jgi:hypothetical protein
VFDENMMFSYGPCGHFGQGGLASKHLKSLISSKPVFFTKIGKVSFDDVS